MIDFFTSLNSPALFFLKYAFLIGIFGSISFGIIGTYIVTRRIASIAGAVSHCILAGIGAAIFCRQQFNLTWLHPIYGSIAAALLSAIIIGLVSMYAKQREDTVIGAIWAIGMAVGLLFLAGTTGYVDVDAYLFGNILLVSKNDFMMTLVLDIIIVVPLLFFFNNFMAVCFDDQFAELRGIRTKLTYMILLCMVALTVVLMVSVIGIILVLALLTLPAAVAGHFTRRLWPMMLLSALLCAFFTTGGLALSYHVNLPSAPLITVLAGITYLSVLAIFNLSRIIKRKKRESGKK